MLTYGDVGTPVDELEEEFAPLQGTFCDVEAGSWWHGGSKNCQKRGTFSEKETSAQFKVCAAQASAAYNKRSAFVLFTMLQNLRSRIEPPGALNGLLPPPQVQCSQLWYLICLFASSRLSGSATCLQERIAAAKRWLERQSESVIFMYGHSVFWRTFFAHTDTLRNCEYRLLHW